MVWIKKVGKIRWHNVKTEIMKKKKPSNFVLAPCFNWKPVECFEQNLMLHSHAWAYRRQFGQHDFLFALKFSQFVVRDASYSLYTVVSLKCLHCSFFTVVTLWFLHTIIVSTFWFFCSLCTVIFFNRLNNNIVVSSQSLHCFFLFFISVCVCVFVCVCVCVHVCVCVTVCVLITFFFTVTTL